MALHCRWGWGEMKIILQTIVKWLSLVQPLNFPEPQFMQQQKGNSPYVWRVLYG